MDHTTATAGDLVRVLDALTLQDNDDLQQASDSAAEADDSPAKATSSVSASQDLAGRADRRLVENLAEKAAPAEEAPWDGAIESPSKSLSAEPLPSQTPASLEESEAVQTGCPVPQAKHADVGYVYDAEVELHSTPEGAFLVCTGWLVH